MPAPNLEAWIFAALAKDEGAAQGSDSDERSGTNMGVAVAQVSAALPSCASPVNPRTWTPSAVAAGTSGGRMQANADTKPGVYEHILIVSARSSC